MTRPHLVFVVNDPAFFLSHRAGIAREALRRNYVVTVVTPNGASVPEIRALGATHVLWKVARWYGNPLSELLACLTLIRILRRLNPTVLHLVTIKPVLFGSFATRFVSIPLVVNSISGLGHIFVSTGTWASFRRAIIKSLYAQVFRPSNIRVLFQNKTDRDTFVRNKLVALNKTFLIKGSGVDICKFTPAPSIRDTKAEPVVLFPARLLSDKGIREFVQAARIVRAKFSARFVIVGELLPKNPAGINAKELSGWTNEKIVEWWGFQENMCAVFQQSDLVVLPSYREGLPKALLEAAACEIAVITTDTPGCRDAIEAGKTGVLVPAQDSIALADAILGLLQNQARRKELGRAGRAFLIENKLTEPDVISKIFEIYENSIRLPSI